MKLGIMQPYFFPYIGYFQLINAVDEFIVYDNIKYTKKGWINRNRILVNGKDAMITLPLKKDSDYLDVRDRKLSDTWSVEGKKMLQRLSGAYRKAPFFADVYPVLERIISFENHNLFAFIYHSLQTVNAYLRISTPLIVSSTVPIDHSLKARDKVLALCAAKKADVYINPIGGTELYDKEDFKKMAIDLRFIKTGDVRYEQFENEFVPFLSIIDVMMFNSVERIGEFLGVYDFV